ncbi:hypothetical protein DYB36_008565 [Aphanomyces astaci]|uniref:EDRF1 N-terminal domain-containing protein n=1 Tax=Aphanomyces astaci TaxID=112090 RepID=A0A397A9E1_APHAT|nr:hypothetical protein DYB36_008565 [Aphanomyces astaci]
MIPPLASMEIPLSDRLDLRKVALSPAPSHSPTKESCLAPGDDVHGQSSDSSSHTHVREVIAVPATSSEVSNEPSSTGVALHEYCQPRVDIVASVDAMKQVFSMPYNSTPKGIAVHRVGRRLVVGTSAESESQRISRRYKKTASPPPSTPVLTLTPPPPAVSAQNPFLVNNWDIHDDDRDEGMDHQLVTDPETGEIFLVCDDDPVPCLEDIAQTSVQRGLHDRFLHDAFSRVSFPLELTMTEHVPPSLLHLSSYQQLVRWQFNSMEMLLGSNTVIFKHKADDASENVDTPTSVTLYDRSTLNALACLDTWLDNVMNNLHQTAFCYHRDGHVQGYHMVRTEDLPFMQAPELFDAHAVFDNAQMILSFLQKHCVDEAQTYWVTKVSDKVHLFQLPTNVFTTADHTVGMLCFQLANSIATHDVRRAQRLYTKCIRMIDAKACPDVAAQACLALGTTLLRPHLVTSLPLRLLETASPHAMVDDLSAALDACEAFARQDGTPKIATLFEIAQRYLPTKKPPPPPSDDVRMDDQYPPPLLDDEAQEKEDFEQALVVFGLGMKWAQEVTATESSLVDSLSACYYVLAHFALHEADLGTALSHTHTLLALLPSYEYPQVTLLVAKLHLRLAATSSVDAHRTRFFATAQRTNDLKRLMTKQRAAVAAPAWVHMSETFATKWPAGDKELHLNVAVACAMHVGTSKATHQTLPLLSVGRDPVHDAFRATLRDAYVSQTRQFVVSGRLTKGARHAEQGLVLFSSTGDTAAVIEMRVLLGEIALRLATDSSGFHKAIGAFTRALSDLTSGSHEDVGNEWMHALQGHVLLLLRLAHAQHALYLQEWLSRKALRTVDDVGGWTAAQSAVRVELTKCLTCSQDALRLRPSCVKTRWRVADAHYLLACLYASHLGLQQHGTSPSVDAVQLMKTCEDHYAAALDALPLAFETCVHHLLLRLDAVKFLLSTGVKIEANATTPPSEAAPWRALMCLVQCAPLYSLPSGNDASLEDRQRVSMLLQGLFRLIEQQVHGCMKALIKLKHPRTDHLKDCYLTWIKHASSAPPKALLARALESLSQPPAVELMRP